MGSTRASIPASMTVSKPYSRYINELVNQAVAENLGIRAFPPDEQHERYGVHVTTVQEAKVLGYLEEIGEGGMTLSKGISLLAWSAWRSNQGADAPGKAPAKASTFPTFPFGNPFAGRPEQALFHQRTRSGLLANGIVLAEAGTGVGKGRVIGALASEFGQRQDEGPVLIIAPTVQILGQLLEEYLLIEDPNRPAASFLFGRDQFVSSKRLDRWLDSGEPTRATRDAIMGWIEEGAGQVARTTTRFHRHVGTLSWLVEDLAAISPTIPLDEIRLTAADPEGDEGHEAYQSLRQNVHQESRVIFSTHSMLVWHRRIPWKEDAEGLLPKFSTLLVDEAQLLASSAESAHSSNIAFRTLAKGLRDAAFWKRYRLSGIASEVSGEVERIAQDLCRTAKRIDTGLRALEHGELDSVRPTIRRLHETLGRLGEVPPAGPGQMVHEARRFASSILNGNIDVRLTFSRTQGCPSLTGGPPTLRFFFEQLWQSVPRAALLSATLYLPRTDGKPSFSLIKTSLHLPAERLKTPPAVLPDWLFTPELHTPETREERLKLSPPQEVDYQRAIDGYQKARDAFNEANEEWLDAAAAWIQRAADTAWGGTLVLIPSYEVVEGLKKRLSSSLEDRLIVQPRGGFRVARDRFIHMDQDRRPVWLATGPAWTGLDLSDRDVPAEDDRLLTDLVIPRIPFGAERSSIHQLRAQFMWTAERDRAAFQFRQGVGRLMRRPGVRRRRLWVLDGRIWTARTPWLFTPIKGILERYLEKKPAPKESG